MCVRGQVMLLCGSLADPWCHPAAAALVASLMSTPGSDGGLRRAVVAAIAPFLSEDADAAWDKRQSKRRRLSFDGSPFAAKVIAAANGSGHGATYLFETARELSVGSADGDPDVVVRCLAATVMQAWMVDEQVSLPTKSALQPIVKVYGGDSALLPLLALHVVGSAILNYEAAQSQAWSPLINSAVMAVGDAVFSSTSGLVRGKSQSATPSALFRVLLSVNTLARLLGGLPDARTLRLCPCVAHIASNFQTIVDNPAAHLLLGSWSDANADCEPLPALALSDRFLHLSELEGVVSLSSRSVAGQILMLAASMLASPSVGVAESVEADVRRAMSGAERTGESSASEQPVTVYLLMRVLATGIRHKNNRYEGTRVRLQPRYDTTAHYTYLRVLALNRTRCAAVSLIPVAIESILRRGIDNTSGCTLWALFLPLLKYVARGWLLGFAGGSHGTCRPLATDASHAVREQLATTVSVLPCVCSQPSAWRASRALRHSATEPPRRGSRRAAPPKAVAAASSPAASVTCPKCTLANEPSASSCTVCGTRLPRRRRGKTPPSSAKKRKGRGASTTPNASAAGPRAGTGSGSGRSPPHMGDDGDSGMASEEQERTVLSRPIMRTSPAYECSCNDLHVRPNFGSSARGDSALSLWASLCDTLLSPDQPPAVRRAYAKGTWRCAGHGMVSAIALTAASNGCVFSGCFFAVRHCDFSNVDVDGAILGGIIRLFTDADHLVAAALTLAAAAMGDAIRWKPELAPCVLRTAADAAEVAALPVASSAVASKNSSGSWLTLTSFIAFFSRRLGVQGMRVLEGTWDMVTGDRYARSVFGRSCVSCAHQCIDLQLRGLLVLACQGYDALRCRG